MDAPELRSVDLLDGEKVLWSGKPVVAMAAPGQAFAKVFGLFFACVAICWVVGVGSAIYSKHGGAGPPGFVYLMPLFGLPFLAVGLYVAFGPNILAARRLNTTVYAITDRRVLIITGGSLRSMKAYDLSSFKGAEKQTRPDGCGAIVFQFSDASALISMYGYRNQNPMMNFPQPGFYGIQDVDSVYRLLEEARTSAAMPAV